MFVKILFENHHPESVHFAIDSKPLQITTTQLRLKGTEIIHALKGEKTVELYFHKKLVGIIIPSLPQSLDIKRGPKSKQEKVPPINHQYYGKWVDRNIDMALDDSCLSDLPEPRARAFIDSRMILHYLFGYENCKKIISNCLYRNISYPSVMEVLGFCRSKADLEMVRKFLRGGDFTIYQTDQRAQQMAEKLSETYINNRSTYGWSEKKLRPPITGLELLEIATASINGCQLITTDRSKYRGLSDWPVAI